MFGVFLSLSESLAWTTASVKDTGSPGQLEEPFAAACQTWSTGLAPAET